MSVIHFATELSGGAGSFVRNIHVAMQGLGYPSLIITREKNDLKDSVTVKPLTRVYGSLRARGLTILGKLGVVNTSYAMFGIERSPVNLSDIQGALGSRPLTAFIFYWVSYFISFESIFKLRQVYPNIPFIFICMDEAFLTGGCHYSWGCLGYTKDCNNCPATSMTLLKNRIKEEFRQKEALVAAINPIIIYPTTNIRQMGQRSAVLRNTRSTPVLPVGAISNSELSLVTESRRRSRSVKNKQNTRVKLLVRSSSEHRKGCDLFASAIKIVSESLPDLRARLEVISIGDKTLTNARIDKYVDHVDMGYVKREELISIYQDIDAFIMTSREDGGPLMINECVALGIFVISTPVGVAIDLVIEKQNGLITLDVSSNAISDALITFLGNYRMVCSEIGHSHESQMRSASLTYEGYIRAVMDIIYMDSKR